MFRRVRCWVIAAPGALFCQAGSVHTSDLRIRKGQKLPVLNNFPSQCISSSLNFLYLSTSFHLPFKSEHSRFVEVTLFSYIYFLFFSPTAEGSLPASPKIRESGADLIGGDMIDKIELDEMISDVIDSSVNFAEDCCDAI